MRYIIYVLGSLLVFSSAAYAEKISLAALSQYLNAITTAEAAFTQVNADGSTGAGKVYISRPGRVRFEYQKPNRSLVIANSGTVAVFDDKSNQAPEQYPLDRTPLSLILAKNVDLRRAKMVVSHREVGNTTRVVAQDPAHPDYGSLEMVFTANPVELRQWVITDDSRRKTTVILGEMAKNKSYGSALFNIGLEIERRGRKK